MVDVPSGWTLDRLVAFLTSFVLVTIVLCGLLGLVHVVIDRWQVLAESPTTLVYVGARQPEGAQPEVADAYVGFSEGVVFAVGYPEDGSLKNNAGICPDQSQIAWLEEFKESIAACGEEADTPLRLHVRGYASIAPLRSEDTVSSQAGNLAIANQRGRQIAKFLALESENFEDCGPTEERFCPLGSVMQDGSCRSDAGNYIVTYADWPKYLTMRNSSPVNDGGRPTPRYSLEFLNRSVHIAVMNNACWEPLSRDLLSER